MAAPLCPMKPGTLEVQRFLGHHIDQARKALQGSQPLSDTAVHEARKQLKKARADLRLLRNALGPQMYAYENRALRDAARPLSAVRDARVLMDTLDALVEHSGAEAHAMDLEQVRLALREEYCERRRHVLEEGQRLGLLHASLRAARARARRLPLGRRGWSVLGAGVKRVYRQGRAAFEIAQYEPSPDHLHAWRKQVKYLWHQLQVLQPIQLEQLTVLVDQAHSLAQQLGEEHDLAVLSHTFLAYPDRFPVHATMQTLEVLITRRRTCLQEKAMTLGHCLYTAPPRLFVERLRAYWRAYRGKAA